MNMIQELYDLYSNSSDVEEALLKMDNELLEYIETNISANEKAIFWNNLETYMKNRDKYFFQTGFQVAKNILAK